MIDAALILQAATWIFISIAFLRGRSASLFHPLTVYLAFHGVVFVFRPFMVHYLDYYAIFHRIGFVPNEEQFIFTLIISTVGLLVFACACWYAGYCRTQWPAKPLREVTRRDQHAFLLTVLLLSPLLTYSLYEAFQPYTVDGTEGIRMMRDLATGITVHVENTGYIVDAQLMIGPLAVLFVWLNRFRWWSFLPLASFIAYRAMIGHGRWSIILMLASLLLIYLYRTRQKWFRAKFIMLAFPLYLLFWALGTQRDIIRGWVTGRRPYTGNSTYEDSKWSLVADTPDFAMFDCLAFITSVIPARSETYTYFTQYLQLFTEPIPRILWSDKPIGPPFNLINLNKFGDFHAFTTALIGDGWLSGGWIGVLVTMAIVGWILGRTHRWFWRRADDARVGLLYCLFLPLTLQWYRDGGISIAKFSIFVLLPILIWIVIRGLMAASLLPQVRVGRRLGR